MQRPPRSPAPQHSRGAAPYQHNQRRRLFNARKKPTNRPLRHSTSNYDQAPVFYDYSNSNSYQDNIGQEQSVYVSSTAHPKSLPSPPPIVSTPVYNTISQPNVVVRSPSSNTAHTVQSLSSYGSSSSSNSIYGASTTTDSYGVPAAAVSTYSSSNNNIYSSPSSSSSSSTSFHKGNVLQVLIFAQK